MSDILYQFKTCPECKRLMDETVGGYRCSWCKTFVSSDGTIFKNTSSKNRHRRQRHTICVLDPSIVTDLEKTRNGITKAPIHRTNSLGKLNKQQLLSGQKDKTILNDLKYITENEFPISTKILFERLTNAYDIEMDQEVHEKLYSLIENIECVKTKTPNEEIALWSDLLQVSPDNYQRFHCDQGLDISDIPIEEIINAIIYSYDSDDESLTIKRVAYLLGKKYLFNNDEKLIKSYIHEAEEKYFRLNGKRLNGDPFLEYIEEDVGSFEDPVGDEATDEELLAIAETETDLDENDEDYEIDEPFPYMILGSDDDDYEEDDDNSDESETTNDEELSDDEKDAKIFGTFDTQEFNGAMLGIPLWQYKYALLLTKLGYFTTAFSWYERAALGDDPAMIAHLGWLYENGKGITKSFPKAFELYNKSGCLDSRTQYLIGMRYLLGYEIIKDERIAFKWIYESACNGNSAAQFYVGYMYKYGLGIEKSEDNSNEWYTRCNHGDGSTDLETTILHGSGGWKSTFPSLQLDWYTKGAEEGIASAQYGLGRLYELGKKVEKSENKAFELYSKAATMGNRNAQYSLGIFYRDGRGCKQSIENYRYWIEMAANQGHVQAKKLIK